MAVVTELFDQSRYSADLQGAAEQEVILVPDGFLCAFWLPGLTPGAFDFTVLVVVLDLGFQGLCAGSVMACDEFDTARSSYRNSACSCP